MQKTIPEMLGKARVRSLSPPRAPRACRLGIIGTKRDMTPELADELMQLLIEDIGNPQSLIVPAGSNSSIYLEAWAEDNNVPVMLCEADFIKNGRMAAVYRDAQIQREATHFIIFGGPRSLKPLQVAQTLAKKGKTVYYLPYGSTEIEEVLHEDKPMAIKKSETGALKHGHT
jgi:hypothetical protein